MSEINRILDLLRHAWDGKAREGPSLWPELVNVSATTAATHPVQGIHSIAEIVLHLAAWHETATRQLEGSDYEPPPAEDWPDVNSLSEPAWQYMLSELRRSFEGLCVEVSRFDEGKLNQSATGKNYSFYKLLHGIVQHDLYHAGQISLLKKLNSQRAQPEVRPIFSAIEAQACARLLEWALEEDLGTTGDLTSLATIPADQAGRAALSVRSAGVVAGLPAAAMTFRRVDPGLSFEIHLPDGSAVQPGARVATVAGRLRSILTGERTALNFIQRLSGVATETRRHVEAIAGLPCIILDTRKTTPGWRVLEKYAVRCGGGHNHRMSLSDGILIKDNHLAALGGGPSAIVEAVRLVRTAHGAEFPLEVEVDTLVQFDAALAEKPDIILLDNMSFHDLREAVHRRNAAGSAVKLEASGGVTMATLRNIAETGVDRISIGALTHSTPALDVGLDYLT